MDTSELLRRLREGDRRLLAQLITRIEEGSPVDVADGSSPHPVIGITGPPGVGKSTLVNSFLAEVRSRGETAAVLAVDPSSPITGGALLGDRIRMQGHIDDPGVFIRSMSNRGHLGGLAPAAKSTVRLLDSAGFDWVLVETVGVGQSEVEVMDVVDVVVLVLAPGWGDQIQADKAGIVEVADLFVVNKADREGASEVVAALQASLDGDQRPILTTIATEGIGVAELLSAVGG